MINLFFRKIRPLFIKDSFKLRGRVEFFVYDKSGKLKGYFDLGWNDITDVGFDFICDVIAKSSQPAYMGYIGIGWGTGANTAFAAGQTDLQGTSKDRNAVSTYNHAAGTKTFYVETTWGVDDPIAGEISVEESGCFNAAAAGTMLNRKTFAGVTKPAADTLKVKWTFTLS